MGMKTLIFLLLLFTSFPTGLYANDTEIRSEGGTIFPVQQTSIEMSREILSLRKIDNEVRGWIQADIYFEFNNPDNDRSIEVGFVCPPFYDYIYNEGDHPVIKNFTVSVNGVPLSYKIAYLDSSSFNFPGKETGRPYFIFYFDAVFKKGLNTVQHSYLFEGGNGILQGYFYKYQVTTGKNWAGGKIKNFELNIDLGTGIHYLPAYFNNNKLADWKIIGTGKFLDDVVPLHEPVCDDCGAPPSVRFVYIQSGCVRFYAEEFMPDTDIIMGDLNPYKEAARFGCLLSGKELWLYKTFTGSKEELNELSELTNNRLITLRQHLMAEKGFVFKSSELQETLNSFKWYMPVASLREDDIKFTPREQLLLDKINTLETKNDK